MVSKWKVHNQSRKGLPDRDFKELNRQAIKGKAVTANTQYTFRKFHGASVRLKEPARQGGIYLPEEEFTYGKSNRPSTPVKAVMSNFYGDVAEQ